MKLNPVRTLRFEVFAILALFSASAETSATPSRFWRTDAPTFRDEFNGPSSAPAEPGANEDPSCYTRRAVCRIAYNGATFCPEESAGTLANLNKCNWSITEHPLNAVSGGSWRNLEVRDGFLLLHNKKGPTPSAENCGKAISPDGDPYKQGQSNECPFQSAQVWSQPYPSVGVSGNVTRYGRFEIRAKLPDGKGSWPAHWLMPDNRITPAWPEGGEIDIMEHWSENTDRIAGSLHKGEVVNGRHPFKSQFVRACELPGRPSDRTFVEEFHVYAAEVEPYRIRFFLDDYEYASIPYRNQWGLSLTELPMYLILNSGTYLPKKKADQPDYDNFTTNTHFIDWIRVYGACETAADFCGENSEYIGTPGDEHCVDPAGKRFEPLCRDYRNAKEPYFLQVEKDASDFEIKSVHPNPMILGETTLKVRVELKKRASFQIEIFDLSGRRMGVVHAPGDPRALHEPGTYDLAWDPLSEPEVKATPGTWIVRLITTDETGVQRVDADHKKVQAL